MDALLEIRKSNFIKSEKNRVKVMEMEQMVVMGTEMKMVQSPSVKLSWTSK